MGPVKATRHWCVGFQRVLSDNLKAQARRAAEAADEHTVLTQYMHRPFCLPRPASSRQLPDLRRRCARTRLVRCKCKAHMHNEGGATGRDRARHRALCTGHGRCMEASEHSACAHSGTAWVRTRWGEGTKSTHAHHPPGSRPLLQRGQQIQKPHGADTFATPRALSALQTIPLCHCAWNTGRVGERRTAPDSAAVVGETTRGCGEGTGRKANARSSGGVRAGVHGGTRNRQRCLLVDNVAALAVCRDDA